METIIGVLLILSFFFMVWYCVKNYNLMIGFVVMSTFWFALVFIGHSFDLSIIMEAPTAAGEMSSKFVDLLTYVYSDGPANYAKAMLVNVFFGAFFGRVLMDTGIASTLIRKVVELGGDKPKITMSLLCVVTSILFMSMTGIGPVISVAVIVLPILMSLGIPAPVAMFAFMGSIMAGVFSNMVHFAQYIAIYQTFSKEAMNYTYSDYFTIGIIGTVVSLVVVLTVSMLSLNKKKSYAWAASANQQTNDDAPVISWISILLPVVGIVLFKLPVILCFILSACYALISTRNLKGTYTQICRKFAKLFTDGAIDVAPMVGFLLALSMFNNAATFAKPYFTAVIGSAVPTSALVLCLVMGILTPLGFFRGPLNLVGAGAAILSVVIAANPNIPTAFLYPLFAITTCAPQHLDVTQSWVAWGFGYTKVSSKDFMTKSIPTGWIIGAIMCAVVYILYGHLV